MKNLKITASILLLAGVTFSQALVVVSRPHVPGAGWTPSDFGPPRQFVATRFRVPGANGFVDVNRIVVWANWASQPVSFGEQNCTLMILSNVDGRPGTPSLGGGFGQFGTPAGADFLYRYEVLYGFPLRLTLGQTYWLHFSGNAGFNFGNLMRWSHGDPTMASESRASFTDHRSGYDTLLADGNHAFQIEGNVTITGPSVISGVLGLDGFASPAGTSAELDIYQGGVLVETKSVSVASDGSFSTTTSRTGLAQITVRSPRFLHRRTPFVTLGFDTTSLSIPLINGDIDGDNEVGIGDYAILSSNFGFENAPGDLDGDGVVDIGDFGILSANFGEVGD